MNLHQILRHRRRLVRSIAQQYTDIDRRFSIEFECKIKRERNIMCDAAPIHAQTGEIISVTPDTDLSKTQELCCNHAMDHSNYGEILGIELDQQVFSMAWRHALEENVVVMKAEHCHDIDRALELLHKCPLRNEHNERCETTLTRGVLCSFLDEDAREIYLELYAALEACRAQLASSNVGSSPSVYLNHLRRVRDSDPTMYVPSEFCPEGFVQNGIHPTTLQYIEMSEGCQFLSTHDIAADNIVMNVSSYEPPHPWVHAMNEVCLICGRPSRSHKHLPPAGFNLSVWEENYDVDGEQYWLNLKTGTKRATLRTGHTLLADVVTKCGGRREMVARAWAVYTVLRSSAVHSNSLKASAVRFAARIARDPLVLAYVESVLEQGPPHHLHAMKGLSDWNDQDEGWSQRNCIRRRRTRTKPSRNRFRRSMRTRKSKSFA